MTYDDINDLYLGRAARMFSRVNGKPCVNVDAETGAVHVCRSIHDLRVDEEGVVEGVCDWLDPDAPRPDELTDGLAIGCDLLDVGDDWWFDIYFGWYYVFRPDLVGRSLDGDHAWVRDFLATTVRNRTVPRPPPEVSDTIPRDDPSATRFYG